MLLSERPGWVPKKGGEGWSGIALLSPSGSASEVAWISQHDWNRPGVRTPEYDRWPECWPYLDLVFPDLGQRVVWARVLKLNGHSTIDWHTDSLPEGVDRYHVPLETSPEVTFEMDFSLRGDGSNVRVWDLPYGKLSFVDPRIRHRVVNSGPTPRVHLVVDARRS